MNSPKNMPEIVQITARASEVPNRDIPTPIERND